MPTKVCAGCAIEKDIEAFNFKNKALELRQTRCRECTKQQVQSHYNRNQAYYIKKARQRLVEMKVLHRERFWLIFPAIPVLIAAKRMLSVSNFIMLLAIKSGMFQT